MVAQNVDYTLIRGTALALSQFLGNSVASAISKNLNLITGPVTSAIAASGIASKLSPDELSALTTGITTALENIPVTNSDQLSSIIKDALLSWTASKQSTDVPLSTIRADFESNKDELFALLNRFPDPAFTEFVNSGTGAQLIYLIATAQTMNQLGMELAIRENFVTLAQQTSSVYAGLINQGIRLSRNTPASCVVSLTTTDYSTTVPPLAAFTINGTNYYNRDQIFWSTSRVQQSVGNSTQVSTPTQSATTSATLYQGTVSSRTVTSNGTPYMNIEIGNRDWKVSNTDVLVFVDGVKWTRTGSELHYSIGLYNYGNDNVWTEYTTATGNCLIQFGNGTNGAIPEKGAQITVYYAETDGSDGNSYNLSSPVSAASYPITGKVLDYSQGGANSRDVVSYRSMAPSLFSAQSRPCSISDYDAFALNYPGIIDSSWQGQQDFAPNDPSMAMVIRGVLLTDSLWSDKDISQFKDWLMGSGAGSTALIGANLQPDIYIAKEVPFDIQVQVFVEPYANSNQIEADIKSNLSKLYAAQAGVINRKVALSDIEGTIKDSLDLGIDYFDVQLPTNDVDVAWDSYATLNNVTVQISPTDRR